ncbi:MAG: DUF4238 domain-containing protein [Firmicutes bacterium]|nr:DUF4238 domain-containing protein [Bacillota bacterium]
MSEAKRHHYIPQFILKNFLDNKGQVFYWDICINTLLRLSFFVQMWKQ